MDKVVRVLSFDPAMSCTGWSIIDYDMDTGHGTIVRINCIKPGQRAKRVQFRDDCEAYGNPVVTFKLLRESVSKIIEEWQPDFIAAEDAFYHPKRPNAYASLINWLCVVKSLAYEQYSKRLYVIPTKVAKRAVTGSGSGGKQCVQDALLNNEEISFKSDKMMEEINLHEGDSAAVGWAFCKTILPTLAI